MAVEMLSEDIMFLWTIIVVVLVATQCAADAANKVCKYGRQTLPDLRPSSDSPLPASLLDSMK